MSEWIPVLSMKETKRAKKLQRFKTTSLEIINKTRINYCDLVDTDNNSISYGLPKPVDMPWPDISQDTTSPLLSERIGSTNGKDFVEHLDYLASYKNFADLLTKYTVPIYHIDYIENMDMGYDARYKCRAPYVESYTINVWTYAVENVPVIHTYCLNVGRNKSSAYCSYEYSYSPVNDVKHEYEWSEHLDCILRMMKK
jgi:hypothetical protein